MDEKILIIMIIIGFIFAGSATLLAIFGP